MTTTGNDRNDGARHRGHGQLDRSMLVDLAYGRLSADDARTVLDRVAADEELSKELDLVILMMAEGQRDERTMRYDQMKERGRTLRETTGAGLVLLRVAAVVLLLLGAGSLIDAALAPPYAHLAMVEDEDLHLRIRDASSGEIAAMRMYLYQGAWEEAARRAEWYLAVHTGAQDRPTAGIIRAAGLLMGAKHDVMGFGVHFDRALVDSALASLSDARCGEPTPGEIEQITMFEAKAFLMRGDADAARSRLRRIVGGGGVYVQDARRILADLDGQR